MMDEPALLLQRTIDRLPIDDDLIAEPQLHPEPAVAERGMHLNPVAQPLEPRRVGAPTPSRWGDCPMQPRSVDAEHLATAAFRDIRPRGSHASDVFRSKG